MSASEKNEAATVPGRQVRQKFGTLLRDLGEGQAADIDLRKKTLVTEQFALIQDPVDELLRTADEDSD